MCIRDSLETTPIEILVAPNPDGIIQNPQPKNDVFGENFFGRNDFFSRDFYGRDGSDNATPPKPIKKPKKKRKTYKL